VYTHVYIEIKIKLSA